MVDIQIDKTKTALVVIDLQKGIVGVPTEPHDAKSVVAQSRSASVFSRIGRVRKTEEVLAALR